MNATTGKLCEYTCTENMVNEDDVAYAHGVQQTHSRSKVSTVANAYKSLYSNSYAEQGVSSFQLKPLVFSSTRMTRLVVIWPL